METDAVITAILVVTVMTLGMRTIYGYWPWQKRPITVPQLSDTEIADLKREWEKVDVMRPDMAAAFGGQPPPFQPFSEADVTTKSDAESQPPSKADKQETDKDEAT